MGGRLIPFRGSMHMRKYFLTVFVLAASLMVATSGLALEKTAVRMNDSVRPGDWNAGTSCTVQYYNTCTGWLWVWSGWSPGDVLGTCFQSCCSGGGTLSASALYVWTAAPSGYGYTGTISAADADVNCCPTNVLGSQVFFPASGWNTYAWGANVGSNGVVVSVALGPGLGSPIVFPTDHPAAGPTGPQACGTCYPSPRTVNSFYYGTVGSPLCPGSSLNDGVCGAELWHVALVTCQPISVEESSFGQIKNLYR